MQLCCHNELLPIVSYPDCNGWDTAVAPMYWNQYEFVMQTMVYCAAV